jgi:hypothetical protein
MAQYRTNVADSFALGSSGFATKSWLHCADGACNGAASVQAAHMERMSRFTTAAAPQPHDRKIQRSSETFKNRTKISTVNYHISMLH